MQALVEVVVAEHKTFDAGGLIRTNRCEPDPKQTADKVLDRSACRDTGQHGKTK